LTRPAPRLPASLATRKHEQQRDEASPTGALSRRAAYGSSSGQTLSDWRVRGVALQV
jgi:hypothetical protein